MDALARKHRRYGSSLCDVVGAEEGRLLTQPIASTDVQR
jgi:hypothetical protein